VTPARPVLFDMDGTLTDSLAIITACFDRTMREEAGVVHEPAFYRRFIGPPLHDSFAELGVADPARFVAEYRRRYAETMLDTPLFPGVRELLERLDAAGVPMVVATSKKEEAARAIVEHLDVSRHFLAVCGADEVGGRVAKHEMVEDALAVLAERGIDPASAVMVGDRKYDVDGAAVHGLPTVLVEWGAAPACGALGAAGGSRSGCPRAEASAPAPGLPRNRTRPFHRVLRYRRWPRASLCPVPAGLPDALPVLSQP